MISRFGRNVLISATSVLVLGAGPIFAEDGVGLDVGVDTEAGVGVGLGGDDESVAADVGAEADADAAIRAGAGADGDADAGRDGDGLEGAAGAAAGSDAEAGIAVDAASQGAIGAEAGAGAPAGIDAMTIAEFSGKRLQDQSGAGIGTVEAVAVDAESRLYLVTALDAMDEEGQERLIPLDQVQVDATAEALVLAEGSADALAQMDDLATSADTYTLVDSDAKLQALLAAD